MRTNKLSGNDESPGPGRWGRIISLGSAILLAAVLLFAGGDKALHYGGFVRALDSYVVVPDGVEGYLALPVILAELALGVGLLVPATRRRAAMGSTALLSVFTVALVINQRLAPEAPCGCTFTLTLGAGDGLHVALNLLLIAVALGLALESPAEPTASIRSPGAGPDPAPVLDGD